MPDGKGLVLSLVERGWSAARKCSLELQREGIGTLHLVKGRLSAEVRGMVEPKPGIRLLSVPRQLFWPAAWVFFTWLAVRRCLRTVFVDNERSQRRLASWPGRPPGGVVLVREPVQGSGIGETGRDDGARAHLR